MLIPVVGQDIYDFGQCIADMGETDKSWGRVWAMGKTQDREGALKAKRLSQLALKCSVKLTWMQMWFDLLAARTPPEKIDRQPNSGLVGLCKALKPEGQLRPVPPALFFPDALPVPAEASGTQSCLEWVSPMSQV